MVHCHARSAFKVSDRGDTSFPKGAVREDIQHLGRENSTNHRANASHNVTNFLEPRLVGRSYDGYLLMLQTLTDCRVSHVWNLAQKRFL